MTRWAHALIVALVVVVIVQAVFFVRARREVARREQQIAKLAEQHELFCGAYRSAVRATRESMEHPRKAGDPVFGYLFYHLSSPSYLDLCHVDEATKAKMVKRGRNCAGAGGEDDYPCLARVARELEEAIPTP